MPVAVAVRPDHPEDWRPHKGPQQRFLSLTCFEALYGGAAGGGKSDCLLVDAIRYVGRGYGTAYQAILFRRTYPELEKSLIVRSHDLYPRIGGRYNEQKKVWTFPGQERVLFGYMQRDEDRLQYQGAAFQFV
ncbi:MAG: terminase, partial [Myxococcales bacterium]